MTKTRDIQGITMGRIKTKLIKRKTYELLKKFGEHFTDNFDANKKKVDEFIPDASKKLRNVIAGYITRLVRKGKEIA